MNKQEFCLRILLNSCKNKSGTQKGFGWSSPGINFYRRKDGGVLIFIGPLSKESESKYLNDYAVISKEEIFLRLHTGCLGPTTINAMQESFSRSNYVTVPDDLSNFLVSLDARKIIICYPQSSIGSEALLLILYRNCQRLNVDCMAIIVKRIPGFQTKVNKYNFKFLLDNIDESARRIYDQNVTIQGYAKDLALSKLVILDEERVLNIANSIME